MNTRDHLNSDEAGIEDLLREVGSRPEPPPEAAQDVYEVVHAEWRATVAMQARRRRHVRLGLAASVLLAIVATFIGVRYMGDATAPMAVIAYVDGPVSVIEPQAATSRAATSGVELTSGDTLRTSSGRAALSLEGGLTVRVDADSVVRLAADDRIELQAGAVYVDSGDGSAVRSLTVETAVGAVRHLGTQYQVRVQEDGIDVLIREGRVEISSVSGRSSGLAGERVQVTASGAVTRSSVGRAADAWRWTRLARAPFDIEDQTLDAFLAWVAEETGRKVVYASEHAQQAAREVRLRGSIAGLEPDAALATVLATTRLHRYPTDDSYLGIALNQPR